MTQKLQGRNKAFVLNVNYPAIKEWVKKYF